MRILVCDDEELIRTVIVDYAEIEGYTCDQACDGNEAFDLCLENKYDLIIMDIMMPNKDGYQACKEIKQDSNVPFIMLSARGEEYDKWIGFDLGIDDYVTKPFSPKELVARVKAIIKRTNGEDELMKFEGLVIDEISVSV